MMPETISWPSLSRMICGMSRIMNHWRRSGLVALVVAWAVLTVSYVFLRDLETPIYRDALPVLFAVTGITTAVFIARPDSYQLWRVSGALSVTALLSRPCGVFLTWWTEGTFRSPWSVVVAFVVWPLSAALLWWFWLHEVGPWYRRHREGHLIKGD